MVSYIICEVYHYQDLITVASIFSSIRAKQKKNFDGAIHRCGVLFNISTVSLLLHLFSIMLQDLLDGP